MVTQNSRPALEERLKPLFIRALDGERAGLHALLEAVSQVAKGYATRKIGNQADTDDVVQTILISVHKALPTYDPKRNCMPWLAAIMHYRLNDYLRSHYAKHTDKQVPIEDVEHFLQNDVTEEPLAYEYVNKAVSNLSQGQQAVIQSMYHEELSVAQTSHKLGMSQSAVKVTAHRAYKKLRNVLKDE